jgi:hypothetical protein
VGPVDLGRGRTARAISAGSVHTCAVLDDGSVRCWGYGEDGRLGTGNTRTIGDDETPGSIPPVDLGPGRTARAVSAGAGHTCAILDNGSVRCWGYGANGRLGYGNPESVGDDETPGSIAAVDLGPGRTATAITVGEAHSCAILDDASLRCWGDNSYGQLGDGSTTARTTPVAVAGGYTFTQVVAGAEFACGLTGAGQAYCWGRNESGQLGDGTQTDRTAPVPVSGGLTFTSIVAGYRHACGVTASGTAYCWGDNSKGQLGDGTTAGHATPTAVSGGIAFQAVTTTTGSFTTCGLATTGAGYCWGNNDQGQLGTGQVGGTSSTPVQVKFP